MFLSVIDEININFPQAKCSCVLNGEVTRSLTLESLSF